LIVELQATTDRQRRREKEDGIKEEVQQCKTCRPMECDRKRGLAEKVNQGGDGWMDGWMNVDRQPPPEKRGETKKEGRRGRAPASSQKAPAGLFNTVDHRWAERR